MTRVAYALLGASVLACAIDLKEGGLTWLGIGALVASLLTVLLVEGTPE
ncbi:hypothetical protein [Microvirga vignae]|nr:hypothetical protein [Microvirga vignae]